RGARLRLALAAAELEGAARALPRLVAPVHRRAAAQAALGCRFRLHVRDRTPDPRRHLEFRARTAYFVARGTGLKVRLILVLLGVYALGVSAPGAATSPRPDLRVVRASASAGSF